jgi:beta-lactamase regulating signal transducer with metallopeptidase domain
MGLPYTGIINLISSRLISSLLVISAIVTFITLLLTALLKYGKESSQFRHTIWFLLILSFITIPFCSHLLPKIQVPIFRPTGASQIIPPPEKIISETKINPSNPTRPVLFTTEEVNPSIKLSSVSIILIGWLTGILFILIRYGVSLYEIRKIFHTASQVSTPGLLEFLSESARTMNIRRRIRIFQSGKCSKPFTCGWLSPSIVIPLRLPEGTEESVILHELAHIKRFDYLTQTISIFICMIFWFLPTSWFLLSRKKVEQENSSDEAAVRAGVEPIQFAENLITFARYSLSNSTAFPALHIAHGAKRNLEIRIKNILSFSPSPNQSVKKRRIKSIILCAFILIIPLSTIEPARSGSSKAFYLGEHDLLSVYSHMVGNITHFRINRWEITGSIDEAELEYDYEDSHLPRILGKDYGRIRTENDEYILTGTAKSDFTQKEKIIKNATTAEIITRYNFGTIKHREVLTYDQKSNLKKQDVYNNSGDLLLYIRYKYSYDQRIAAEFYDSSGIMFAKRVYTYDPYQIHRLVRIEHREKYKPIRYYDFEYRRGRIVKQEFYEKTGSRERLLHYLTFEYDENGNKIVGFLYSSDSALIRRFIYF